jgi:hypothetical protein
VTNWTFRRAPTLILAGLVFAFGCRFANAANLPLSGSYEVIGKTIVSSRTKVLLRLHLTNHGPGPLVLKNILLWDHPHPPSAGAGRFAITLNSGSTEETTQEFVVSRGQFEQWQRGLRPRVVLELRMPTGARMTQAMRLDRIPARKGE